MWTLGSFCSPRLDPEKVFERTDVMAGPSHEPANITKMVRDLHLGDGRYAAFSSPAEARTYMMNSMMERFAFGVSVRDRVGHMVSAYRVDGQLRFVDFQIPPHDGRAVQLPEQPDCVYTIWPIG
jgi:hypothetical protein